MTKKISIGTRGSDLALVQTRHVSNFLTGMGITTSEKIIVTKGDQDSRPFRDLLGDGFFTKEIEQELARNHIQMAVHSAKDLPSMIHEGLPWRAVGQREQARDLVIAKKEILDQLDAANFFEVDPKVKAHGLSRIKIGTSSPRRLAQARLKSPDVAVVPMRGNVPTRLKQVVDGTVDAVILGQAGINRLGGATLIQDHGLEARVLNWTTAPCQGVIAVQANSDGLPILEKIANVELDTIAKAEKSLLALLGGGCQLPVGAHVRLLRESKPQKFALNVFYFDGKSYFDFEIEEERISDLLREAFVQLAGYKTGSARGRRVWLTGPLQHLYRPAQLLIAKGLEPVAWPLIEVRPYWDSQQLRSYLNSWKEFGAVAFGSSFGARLFLTEFASLFKDTNDLVRIPMFAVGPSTAAPLLKAGFAVKTIHDVSTAKALVDEIQKQQIQGPILIPGTAESRLRDELKVHGLQSAVLELYRSTPSTDRLTTEMPVIGDTDAVILTSPSGVRQFNEWTLQQPALKKLEVFAFGPSTSDALTDLNIEHTPNSQSGNWEEMIELVSRNS